jgi:hypothetical protein
VRTAVRSAAIVLTGVFTGFLIAVLIIEATLRGYDAHVYTQVRLIELARLDTLASVTLLPALVLTAVDAFWARHDRLRTLVWVALALLLAVLTVSASVNLPINEDQAGWNIATPPPTGPASATGGRRPTPPARWPPSWPSHFLPSGQCAAASALTLHNTG